MIKIFKKAKRFFVVFKKRYKQREKPKPIYREKYKLSVTVITITILLLALMAGAYYALLTLSSGTYLSGWFLTSAIIVVILLTLSAPYSIVLASKHLVLHGYIDIYQIPIESITSIEVLEKRKYIHYLPIFFSFGYLGYFGYYLNWKKMEVCKVYVTKYSNWVVAKTIENNNYIFNVKNPAEFINKFNTIKMGETE